ncbi:hypothetical protein [Oceanobacillus sp. CAU 1775]
MVYIDEMQYFFDMHSFGIILELLFVTACISTIIFILSKNKYVSILSAAPVFFAASLLQYQISHLFLLLVAMFIQAVIITAIQQRSEQESDKKEEKQTT